MKFELTNPKAWKAVSERKIPMGDKIKVYEKLGGAYRLGEDGGEQVFNDIKELLKHKLNEEDSSDHEVGMALGHLDDIIKNANELKGKVGTDETDLAGWIQDHISQAQNYINQANTGFHKLDGQESVNEGKLNFSNVKAGDKLVGKFPPYKELVVVSSNGKNSIIAKNSKSGKTIEINSTNNYELKEQMNEGIWPKSKLKSDRFEFALADELKKNFKGIFYVIGYDLYHNDKKVLTIDGDDSINVIIKKLKSTIKESVTEAKYPTDLKVGSVIQGQGFTRLKGIDGGKYYKIVDMDDTTATLTRTDPSGKVSSPTKVRHKLDSIEGGIKTAKRGDENGIVVIKEELSEGMHDQKIKSVMQNSTSSFKNLGNDFKKAGLKYNFSTTPFPHYIVEPGGNKKVAIVSRKNEYGLKGSGIQYSTYIATIKESINEGIKVGSVILPYAHDKYGEFVVDKVFKNKDGETSYTGKFKKNGEKREFILHSKDKIVKESVNEGVSPKDMDKIKSAVEAASSFMNVGAQLKATGLRYIFATEPLPIYIVNPTATTKVAIVSKKYASKPDFVVGDIAVGVMD